MAYSNEQLKSNQDQNQAFFRPFRIWNEKEKYLPDKTPLYLRH